MRREGQGRDCEGLGTRDGDDMQVDVIGIGAATLDHLWRVPAFSAEEGVQQALGQTSAGGGPVATALCVMGRLGSRCALLDSGGDDAAGAAIRQELEQHGVSTHLFQIHPGAISAQAVVLVRAADGARQIFYQPANSPAPAWNPADAEALRGARLLHLNGRHEDTARAAVACAQEHGIAISFDGGAGRHRESLRDLVDASHLRILALDFARRHTGLQALEAVAAALLQPPAALVVLTDGVRGSHVFTADGAAFHQPAFPAQPVVDTTGCGDVYHGAFLHGWLAGNSLHECAALASKLAAKNAEGLGGRHVCATLLPGE